MQVRRGDRIDRDLSSVDQCATVCERANVDRSVDKAVRSAMNVFEAQGSSLISRV